MTDRLKPNSESVKEAYNYFLKGKIHEMEQILNSVSATNLTNLEDELTYKLLLCYQLLIKSDYDKCQQETNSLLIICEKQNKFVHLINACIILAEIYEWTGKYKEGIQIIEKGEQKLNNLESNEKIEKKIWLTHFRGRIAYWQGDLDKAQNYFEETLILSKETQNEYVTGVALQNVGLIRFEKSDFEGGLKYHEEAYQLFKKVGNKYRLAWCLQNLGVFEATIRNFDKSLTYLKESLKYREELGNIAHIPWSLDNIGHIYSVKGDLNQALEYYQKSLLLREKIGNKLMMLNSNLNLASVYRRKGDLEESINYLKKSHELLDKSIDKRYLMFIAFRYALVYWMKGEIKRSMDTMEENLSLINESGTYIDDMTFSNLYFWMIIFALDSNDLNKANKYLLLNRELLQKMSDKFLIQKIQQNYELIDALLLKKSSRIIFRRIL